MATELKSVIAEIEQAMSANVFFEPIWSRVEGSFTSHYACVDDNRRQARLMVPGTTELEAATALRDDLRRDYPDLFASMSIAAE